MIRNSYLFHYTSINAFRVHPAQLIKLRYGALFNEAVWHTYSFYSRRIAIVCHEFQHGTSKTSANYAVLHRDDAAVRLSYLVEQRFVEGFQVYHIVVGYRPAFCFRPIDSFCHFISYRADT